MSITLLFFLGIFISGSILCIYRGPVWGLLVYMFIYFIVPNYNNNWWAKTLPNLRWSILAITFVLVGCFFHKEMLSDIRLNTLKIGRYLIAFLFLSLIVSIFAVNPERSFGRCYEFFKYIFVIFLFVKCVKKRAHFEYIIILILVSGFILGYFALDASRYAGRLEGIGPLDANDANGLAVLLSTMIPFSFPAFFSGKKITKYLVPVCLLFMFNCIILCNSRGGTIVFGFTILMVLFLSIKMPKFRLVIFILIILGGSVFIYLGDVAFWERFKTIENSIVEDRGSGRLDIWIEGFQMFVDHPFGIGGDGFKVLSSNYISDLTTGGVRSSHNTYLLVLVEQGYLGLLFFCSWNAHILLQLRRTRKTILFHGDFMKGDDRFFYLLNIAVTASLSGYLVGAVVGNRLYFEYYYFVIAFATSLSYYIETRYNDVAK